MQIILKFILKNIYEKKFRTFLILFSIVISSALYFASGAMSGTMVKMFEDRMRNYYGTAEIIIHANNKSPSSFFNTAGADKYKDRFEYSVGLIQGSASYRPNKDETVGISLVGADIYDFQGMNPVIFESEENLYPFTGKKAIISKNTAEKYGLKMGDTVEFEMRNAKYRFTISGICVPSGLFFDDGSSTYAIVPRDTLAGLYDARGKVNMIGLKLKNPEEKQEVIKLLSKEYGRFTVREPFSREELAKQLEGMTTTFMLMAVIVTMMSVFIIFTSFKVVTMERLPVIGTFRSIGATRKMTDFVLLAESTVYGILGGGIGCVLGIGILYLMALANRPIWQQGYKAAIEFTPSQLLSAFIFAVLLSFISCIIPIIQISKIPVKDIVLNSIDKQRKKKIWKPLLGIFLLAYSFFAPPLAPKPAALIINVTGMIVSVVGIILLVPYLTSIFVRLFENFYVYIFGNIGTLAAKNLRENKSILNNVALLAIGISSLLMINTISSSVVKELTSFYRSATFDIWIMNVAGQDRNFEHSLRRMDGVAEVYGAYEAYNVEIPGSTNRISLVQGVDKTKFAGFWSFDMGGEPQKLYNELDEGRNVIITYSLKDRLGVKEGDMITLKMSKGNKSYKIIGFMNTLRNNGSYALISEKYARMDTGAQFYSNTFVRTSKDPEEVLKSIQKEFARRRPFMRSVKQMEALERQSNANTFMVLKGFSIMSLIIGIFGVLNNLVISFIERKRHLAMFRAVGMSRRQIRSMILIEAVTGGFIGGVIGVLSGFLMLAGVPYVLKSINLSVPIHYPMDTLWAYLMVGITIVVVASISPAVKSSKLNIIEAIKYE